MKKVAVWGPNRWCNFGDDLQSVVFALHLKSEGYHPVVFQLDYGIAREHDLDVADTVDDLLKDARLCIIAGGALLGPSNPIRRVLHHGVRQYARYFKDLHRGAKKHGTKFCAISMGGDGKTRNRWLWYDMGRNRFFASKYFLNGTVRLEGDVQQMKCFGKDFKYFPDCLFSLNRFVTPPSPYVKKEGEPIRIGFNLRKRHVPPEFLRDLYAYAADHTDIEFHFATTHMDKVIFEKGVKYEYLPGEDTETVKFVHYRSPKQLLKFMAEMDAFVASKLHLGLTGLLVGTPFISYTGMGKARTFVRSLGGDRAILEDDVSFGSLVADNGIFRKPKTELMRLYDMEKLQQMVDESQKQFEFCSLIANEHA